MNKVATGTAWVIAIVIVMVTSFNSNNNTNTMGQLASVLDAMKPPFSSLSTADFATLNQSTSTVIIDVRTPQEFDSGHISNAINIDIYESDFVEQMEKLDRSATYAIYCRSGNRSGQTLDLMNSLGFTSAYDLDGGIINWPQAELVK